MSVASFKPALPADFVYISLSFPSFFFCWPVVTSFHIPLSFV